MPPDSWLARRLSTAGTSRRLTPLRVGAIRQRRPPVSAGAGRRFVVCGDDALALRLTEELVTRHCADVVVIGSDRRRNQCPQIAKLPRVRLIESGRLDVEAFRLARLQTADAVAIVRQDDVGNIHAALQAQEYHPGIRLVIRMFNMSLGHAVASLFTDCAILSDAAMAAPAFVSAAVGAAESLHVRAQGRILYVAKRMDVRPEEVICGLADSDQTDDPDVLPSDPVRAGLVLAVADGAWGRDRTSGTDDGGAGGAVGDPLADAVRLSASGDGDAGEAPPTIVVSGQPALASRLSGRWRRWWRRRRPLASLRTLLNRKLWLAALALFGVLMLGTVASAAFRDVSWWDAAYLTILTELGGPNADLSASWPDKITQAVLVIAGLALIPVITAAIVEAIVNARLALALGRLRNPISDHIVVVGLGNVGTRVIRQLHELGLPLVAIDKDETARGAEVARMLDIPFITGDASREETLRAASVQTCAAFVCLSNDDVTNLEAALYARNLKEGLRVVLRLFDDDFADRVQRASGITISRSVSFLAAPAFAAAMLERDVLGTIPIGPRVLLVAQTTVGAGSALDGRTISTANDAGSVRVIAVATASGPRAQTLWSPPSAYVLAEGDVLVVVATRVGLGRMLAKAGAAPDRSVERPPVAGG